MFPVQITIRGVPTSPVLESHIHKRAMKLSQFYDRIVSCKVVVELIQKHKHQGKLFNVRIDLMVPGKNLVVNRKQDEDSYVALRDAFNAIERKLEEHSRKRHGRVKSHSTTLHGYVVRLIAREGYGFIEGDDGIEYYFSLTNVSHPNFKQLAVGDGVEYTAEPVSDGWQAQHIVKERNHHTFA